MKNWHNVSRRCYTNNKVLFFIFLMKVIFNEYVRNYIVIYTNKFLHYVQYDREFNLDDLTQPRRCITKNRVTALQDITDADRTQFHRPSCFQMKLIEL